MLNANINYPYPVIREYLEDYQTTVFKGSFVVNLLPDGYLVRPRFEILNDDIADLIAEGKLTYALEVQSPATWFRKLFPVKDNKPIYLDPTSLHERVELTPCIIAAEHIPNFTNKDFETEYCGMAFEINAGDIIAIGEKRCFDALYQNDIIKNGSSIVKIEGSDKAKEVSCDFSGSVITITLPVAQFDDYTECGCLKPKYKTLNAILTVPVLVEAIGIIASDERNPEQTSGFESHAWYKTIVVNLKRAAENNESKYRNMLEKPFASAELLLGNNYAFALEFVKKVE